MLFVVGTANIIYGIGALGDASIFVDDMSPVLDNLKTLGWALTILGVRWRKRRFDHDAGIRGRAR